MLNTLTHQWYGDYNETKNKFGVRRLHEAHGQSPFRATFRNSEASQEVQKRRAAQARPETEIYFRRFPRPWRENLIRARFPYRINLVDQFLVHDPLASDPLYGFAKSVRIAHFSAVVVTEYLLIQVTEQVKRLDADIGSVRATLQETPEVLQSVCVYVTANVFNGMVYHFVCVFAFKANVGQERIGEDCTSGLDVFTDLALQFSLLTSLNLKRSDFAFALDNSHNGSFVFWPASGDFLAAFVDVHVPRFPADERLINLDLSASATELTGILGLHRKANSMEHEPSGFLCDTESAVNFPRANTILAVGNHPDRGKPLVQTERAILKNGSDLDGELPPRMLHLAFPNSASRNESHIGASASRTRDAIGPAALNDVVKAVVRIGEIFNGFG